MCHTSQRAARANILSIATAAAPAPHPVATPVVPLPVTGMHYPYMAMYQNPMGMAHTQMYAAMSMNPMMGAMNAQMGGYGALR